MTDARARGNAATPLPEQTTPRSEGQRLLRLVPGSLSAIATKVGADKGTVSRWRSGEKVPAEGLRLRLQTECGIDPAAWDRRPLGYGPPVPEPSAAPPDSQLGTTLEETLWAMALIKKQLSVGDLTSSDRKSLTDNYTKLLAVRGREEARVEGFEARVVRDHPMWRSIVRGLPDVLRPWPDAATAVLAWLGELEAGS
jgi:transcriptional regulator with XRE-family HTH domain